MSNFTDLEDSIMDCWGVITDLLGIKEASEDTSTQKLLSSIHTLYNFKFERMLDLYENCLKEHYELKNKKPLLDVTIERIADKYADIGGDIPADKWIAFAREVIEADEDYIPW